MDLTTSSGTPRWYLLRTRHREESRAEGNLARGHIETFLPRHRTWRSGTAIIDPLFPQYLFARFDHENSSRLVGFTRGVQNIVQFGGEPAVVDDDVIVMLRARADADGYVTIAPALRPGTKVTVDDGPFQSLAAVVERKASARDRVSVLLESIGRGLRVEMPTAWLRASA